MSVKDDEHFDVDQYQDLMGISMPFSEDMFELEGDLDPDEEILGCRSYEGWTMFY